MSEYKATYNLAKMKIWFNKNERGLFSLYVLMIIYLLYNTGIVGDDFSFINDEYKFSTFFDSIKNGNQYLGRPVFKYFFSMFYYFIDINQFFLIDILKTIQIIIIFYMITRFFSIYINASSAMMVAFLFIFFPTHDSTTYWYLEVSLSLGIGLYLYAYYLVSNNRFIFAGISSFLASFVSYGSPPIAFTLFILCLLKKSYKQGLILFLPNVVYAGYFIFVTKFLNQDVQRIPNEINIFPLLKQYILQVGTFIDATIGPSFFLKLYYSILENDLVSIILAVIFIVGYVLISRAKEEKEKTLIDKNLLIVLTILILTSCGIFAITGGYPQLAFNLGNRTTIYGSLLFSYLLVTLPIPENARKVILFLILVSMMGISTHWKNLNQHQQRIIENIRMNPDLASYQGIDPIYVTGNQYSKMGPFSNIEFLSENWVVESILKLSVHEKMRAKTLNKRLIWENGILIDKKYKNLRYPIEDYINVYDSENNKLMKISAQNINSYIRSMPHNKRHWIQMIDNEQINALLLKLMTRLKYAF